MRIGLLTTLEHNLGDDFIREGLLHVLRTLRPTADLTFEAVNKHHPHTVNPVWHPARVAHRLTPCLPRGRIKLTALARRAGLAIRRSRFDGCDLVLQCGTPVIWENCRESEWATPIWRDVLARLSPRVPLLNLGAGSCYPWERQPATLVGNADEEFVRLMLQSAATTTVRDSLAAGLFRSLGFDTEVIACPAFLAAQAFVQPATPGRRVLINYMVNGAHARWDQEIDAGAWEATMRTVVSVLRKDWDVAVLSHNESERETAERIWPDLPHVLPRTVGEYFDFVRTTAFAVFNRLHAGVALAGLGIPSVCIGTDTRMLMAQNVGLPVFFVRDVSAQKILASVARLAERRNAESARLLALRAATFDRYRAVIAPWLGAKAA